MRTTGRLARAVRQLRALESEIERFYRSQALTDDLVGMRSAVRAAIIVANAAWANRQGVGCHYREWPNIPVPVVAHPSIHGKSVSLGYWRHSQFRQIEGEEAAPAIFGREPVELVMVFDHVAEHEHGRRMNPSQHHSLSQAKHG